MNKLLIFLLSLCVTSLQAATITNWGAQLPTAVPASGDAILMQKGGVTYFFTPNQLATQLSTNANLVVGGSSDSNALYSIIIANGATTSNGLYLAETTRNAAVSNGVMAEIVVYDMATSNLLYSTETTRNAAVSNAVVALISASDATNKVNNLNGSATNVSLVGNTRISGSIFRLTNDSWFIAGAASNFTSSGQYALAAGHGSLTNGSGNYNTAYGAFTLEQNTTGSENSAGGPVSLRRNTSGAYNSGWGSDTLTSNTIGTANSALGGAAGVNNTVGSYNTALGATAGPTTTNLTNTTAIGYGSVVGSSDTITIGAVGQFVSRILIGSTTKDNYGGLVDVRTAYGTRAANAPAQFLIADNVASQTINTGGAIDLGGYNSAYARVFSWARMEGNAQNSSGHGGYLNFMTESLGGSMGEAARIDQLRNFGIGTILPAARVDIAGTVDSYILRVNTNTLVVTNGNVAIGTNVPTAKLSVVTVAQRSFDWGNGTPVGALTVAGTTNAYLTGVSGDLVLTTDNTATLGLRVTSGTGFTGVRNATPTNALDNTGNTSLRSNVFLGAITNVFTFGATNPPPASAVAPTKWISVRVAGEAGLYRLPLYE